MGFSREKILKWLAAKWGYEIKRLSHEYPLWDDPARSHMLTSKYHDKLIKELAEVIHAGIGNIDGLQTNSLENTMEIVKDFYDVYLARPFTNNLGGSSFHNSLWLYTIILM